MPAHRGMVETWTRCTELFFLYYFKYTTKLYNHSNIVEADLSKECGYMKTTEFFRKHLGDKSGNPLPGYNGFGCPDRFFWTP